MSPEQPTIVVFRSAALGDFILATPAFRILRNLYPKHRVVLLTMQSSQPTIRDSVARYSPNDAMPWLQLAMPHLIDEVIPMESGLSARHIREIRKKLESRRIDLVVILADPGASWTGRIKKLLLLAVLTASTPIVGWRARGSLSGDPAALKRAGQLPHHALGLLHFLSELKPPRRYDESDVQIDVKVPPAADDWAREWLGKYTAPGSRLVFVAPGSVQPHKRWPLDNFLSLCRHLLERFHDVHIVVVGTHADRALGETIEELAPSRIANAAGAATVAQSAGLISRGSLLVGNDGGAMHLGDAVGCKVVSLVPGIQYPDSIEPWNSRRLAIRHEVPCAPCYSFLHCPKGHNACMRDLPLDRVLEQCVAILKADNFGRTPILAASFTGLPSTAP